MYFVNKTGQLSIFWCDVIVFRSLLPVSWNLQVSLGDEAIDVSMSLINGQYVAKLNNEEVKVDSDFNVSLPVLNALIDGQPMTYQVG